MKKFVLIISFFIIGFIILACASENIIPGETTTATEKVLETTTTSIERPNIPSDTNYGGYEFRFLIPVVYQGQSCDYKEIYVEEEIGETLNDVVYKRNLIVEDLLNIKITAIVGTTWHEMPNSVRLSVQSGSDDFDAIAGAYQPRLAFEGCLVNFYNIPNINLSKPWWDQCMIESLSYKKSKLYYISGDIGYYDKYGSACLLFNKNLFSDNSLEDPYKLIKNGQWTLDEFSGFIKGFARDLNGDGIMDENDQWGLTENSGGALRTLFGCGERIINLDSDGIPYLGAITERHTQAVMKIGEILI